MRSYTLRCPAFEEQLKPVPTGQALARLSRLLTELEKGAADTGQSRSVKEQFLAQTSLLEAAPEVEFLTQQAQAAGFLCGALDGARIYLEKEQIDDFVCPVAAWNEQLRELEEVADQYWRGLDLENLRQQMAYARQQNLQTQGDNLRALGQGVGTQQIRGQLSETFRIAYGAGLLEAAQTFLFMRSV